MTPPTTTARSARAKVPLTKRHLARLSKIAAEDHEGFYKRHPEYQGRLLAVVLAQGAALHYLDRRHGVKDLDVWSFFALPSGARRFPEDKRNKHVDFGPSDLGRQRYVMANARSEREATRWATWHREHQGRRVDLMMRGLHCQPDAEPVAAIRQWLEHAKPKSSPDYLSQQAVILVDPPHRRGETVWSLSDGR